MAESGISAQLGTTGCWPLQGWSRSSGRRDRTLHFLSASEISL